MKTKSLSLLLLASLVTAVSCSPKYYANRNRVPDEMPDGGSYTERVVPVVTKIAPDGQVTLRFYDNMPNVAYISAADFQSIVLPGSTMTVTHTGAGQYTLTNADATATVNINDDVFVSDQFEAFTNQMGLLQPEVLRHPEPRSRRNARRGQLHRTGRARGHQDRPGRAGDAPLL